MASSLAHPDALASDRSGADLLGLVKASSPVVEITLVGSLGRSRPGVRVHRAGWLAPADRCVAQGVPCTSVARTLLDLAARSPRRIVNRAIEQAEALRVFDLAAVEAICRRSVGHHGIGALRDALADYTEPSGVRLELERRFLELVREAGLPLPERNVWLPGPALEADFVWRHARVVV